eukprot:149500-Pelagomonas_calceolata.AAC.1
MGGAGRQGTGWELLFRGRVAYLVKKDKNNHLGGGSTPYINQGKGDTLAQKSHESSPPQSCKIKSGNGDLESYGSTRLQDLAVRSIFVSNSTCYCARLVVHKHIWINLDCKTYIESILVASGLPSTSTTLQPERGFNLFQACPVRAWAGYRKKEKKKEKKNYISRGNSPYIN